MRASIMVLLIATFPAKAADVQIFGSDKPVPQYAFAELSVKTDKGDQLYWEVSPSPVKIVEKEGQCFFSGPPGAKYRVSVIIVNFDTKRFDRGRTEVIMEGTAPDVIPPDDDDPIPDPTAATLTNMLKGAFKKEKADEKRLVPNLIEVYIESADEHVGTSKTWGDLWIKMAAEAEKQQVTGKLMELQLVIQTYLQKHLPSEGAGSVVMDKTAKRKAREAFRTVSNALSKLPTSN